MKLNVDWLREFVEIDGSAGQLAEDLTMAGLEVDDVVAVAGAFEGVIIAEILEKRAHPDADRLSICRVFDGSTEHEIVCGAPNAAAGIKVPFAPVGTALPGELVIKAAKIRGVRSEGMLCSAKELGLSDDAAGLLVLDPASEPGRALREYLKLDDYILDIDLTPNRGDCFSVLGVAREISARRLLKPLDEALDCVEPSTERTHDVELIDTAACPRFAGRVVSGLATDKRSPDWLRERLRRGGLRPIHPIVDVTNYVMLEYGQPLHAYRLDKLTGPIEVRFARAGEKLTLLDESTIDLDPEALVIADRSGPIGLAGIMGGLSTAVDAGTEEIFLESAYFSPAAIQGRARRHGLHTDASLRFERGVDPTGQERAIERATALLVEMAGGKPGPISLAEDGERLPRREPIALDAERAARRLGLDLSREQIEQQLAALGMDLEPAPSGWRVLAPSYRFDISIEADLIEEVGRMIGYDRIPARPGVATVPLGRAAETSLEPDALGDLLVARGYTEIVSYSFTESGAQSRLTGSDRAVPLANPISQDLNVLRSSLWPGLLQAVHRNLSHQIERCRLFEIGTIFEATDHGVAESTHVAGLITGSRLPPHWDGASPDADFFDLKGDVESLLACWRDETFRFVVASNPALNPARSAAILRAEEPIGWLGELHPALHAEYGLKAAAVLFEIDLDAAGPVSVPKFREYSRFPAVRRDLALVVDEDISVDDLTKLVSEALGEQLREVEIFDLYRGKGVDIGRKSVGMGLILQDAYRTLTDEETDDMIRQVVRRLEHELGAKIRN